METDKRKGCKECRLVGGFGLIGAATYVFYNAKATSSSINRVTGYVFGIALLSVGIGSLLDIPPFQRGD